MDNNGQQWTGMDDNGQKLTTLDNNGQHQTTSDNGVKGGGGILRAYGTATPS